MTTTRRTSKEAYRSVLESGYVNKKCTEIYSILYNYGPMSANEIGDRMEGKTPSAKGHNVHARIDELRRGKLIYELQDKRPCPITDKCVMWFDVTENLAGPVPEKIDEKAHLKKCKQCLEMVWKNYGGTRDFITKFFRSEHT